VALKPKKVLISAPLLSILTGCGSQKDTWVIGQNVDPSQLPAVVVQMVDKEAGRLGNKNPKIVSVTTDVDDATHKPMYQIDVEGNFTSGGKHRNHLHMIVLKDGSRGGVRTGDISFDEDFTMTNTIK
jgi:hypothetical protein